MNAKFFRNGIVMLVLVVGTVALLYTWLIQAPQEKSQGYSQFLDDVKQQQGASVDQQGETLTVKPKARPRAVHRHGPSS